MLPEEVYFYSCRDALSYYENTEIPELDKYEIFVLVHCV
jgi:hypothetical protein